MKTIEAFLHYCQSATNHTGIAKLRSMLSLLQLKLAFLQITSKPGVFTPSLDPSKQITRAKLALHQFITVLA